MNMILKEYNADGSECKGGIPEFYSLQIGEFIAYFTSIEALNEAVNKINYMR